MALQALYDAIVADMAVVRDAYESAGLFRAESARGLDETERRRRDLLLTDAVLRNRVSRLWTVTDKPRHLVVFGGNNVGKSTVVNVLAADSIAGTSPEGGYTRHAHGFRIGQDPPLAATPRAFDRFRLVPAAELQVAGFDCYAVSDLDSGELPDGIVLWDSPDCDSVGSSRYVAAVVEAASIAGLLVYVTSVEKYAVSDLVEWLFDLTEAGIDVLACLNKTPGRDRPVVMRRHAEVILPALAERLQRPVPVVPMIGLRMMTEGAEADLWGPHHPEAAELRAAALTALASAEPKAAARAALRFACDRIDGILAPARDELTARTVWTGTVGAAVNAFLDTYEAEYLGGQSVIDPFTKLNVQLLDLLNPNIPGLSEVMRALRKVRRLPTDLLKLGWRLMVPPSEEAKEAKLAPELRAYAHAHRALLRAVHERIEAERAQAGHHPFWDTLADLWQRRAADLAEAFRIATEQQIERTDAEIRQAARDILQALEKRPAVLGLLRTVRLSTEVGGFLVGFAIPGHGHIGQDLLESVVIAPLMMSATGAAADYAVEGYVAQRRSEIVARLRTEARDLATERYAAPLHAVGREALEQAGMVGLPQDVLDRLPANLRSLRDRAAA